MHRSRYAWACMAAVAVVAAAPRASANGRFPTAKQLVAKPGQPAVMALDATFGILVTADQGQSWDWICEPGMGYGTTIEDPAIGMTAGGALLVALPIEGLDVSPDTGCSWGFAAGVPSGKPAIDVAVRPGTPHAALALVATQLLATADDGAHWALYGTALDPTLEPTTVDVTASDPHRVYVTATRRSATSATASLFVSLDDGTTWTEHPVTAGGTTAPQQAYVAAVDPTNAALVYLRTGDGTSASQLLVTTDGGATFRAVYAGGPMLGFALAPDGSRIYLGGPEDGLETASTTDLQFTQSSPIPVGCIAWTAGIIYVCVLQSSVLVASSTDGINFAPLLHLKDLRGPLSCPAGSSASTCATEWPSFSSTYGIGSADAGADGGQAAPPPPSSSSGCGVLRAEGSAPSAAVIAGVVVLLAAIGRSRSRSRTPARSPRCRARTGHRSRPNPWPPGR